MLILFSRCKAFAEDVLMRVESIETVRRILLRLFRAIRPSFGTFEYSYPLTDGRAGVSCRPQGLLLIAAYLPGKIGRSASSTRTSAAATKEDFEWAGSGIRLRHAHPSAKADETTSAAGRNGVRSAGWRSAAPSVSACPDYYPSFDYLHVGELGDATDETCCAGWRAIAPAPSGKWS